MILFYNFPELQNSAIRYNISILRLLSLIANLKKPKSTLEAIVTDKLKQNKERQSFLLHPERLIANTTANEAYKLQYLTLASCRDYSLYKLHKYTGLQTSFFPELDMENIKHNPILTISNNSIYFNLED